MFKFNQLRRRMAQDEQGMTTAEYAVGTVAATGAAGILISILSSPEFRELLWNLFKAILGNVIPGLG